jgi:hypothetical protein
VEALLRSILLVLMDNATAEYTFVTTFFAPDSELNAVPKEFPMSPPTANTLLSPMDDEDTIAVTPSSERGTFNLGSNQHGETPAISKEDQNALNAIWKYIMDPALEHSQVNNVWRMENVSINDVQTFIQSSLDPVPPTIPLLTMIRLTEDVVNEVQKRGCAPLENFVFAIRIKMWPVFQKIMSDHVEQLRKYAEGASGGTVGGFFGRGVVTTDSSVVTVSYPSTSLSRKYNRAFSRYADDMSRYSMRL